MCSFPESEQSEFSCNIQTDYPLLTDVEHIMRLGGWESLDMVLRYTRSVRFEESLRLYQEIGR